MQKKKIHFFTKFLGNQTFLATNLDVIGKLANICPLIRNICRVVDVCSWHLTLLTIQYGGCLT